MATTAQLPKSEAKVQVRTVGTNTWRDAMEFDPIMLPVEDSAPGDVPLTTDVFDDSVMTIVEAVIEAETDSDHSGVELMLVWSDFGFPVKGTCPVCDDVFVVSEGFVDDLPDAGGMSGTSAVCCGCVDD